MEQKTLWFKRKTYGWGWTPANWKGWAVIAAYCLAVVLYPIGSNQGLYEFRVYMHVIFLALLTSILILVCYWKGESPEWNWGKRT